MIEELEQVLKSAKKTEQELRARLVVQDKMIEQLEERLLQLEEQNRQLEKTRE